MTSILIPLRNSEASLKGKDCIILIESTFFKEKYREQEDIYDELNIKDIEELSEEFKFEISPGNYRTLEEKAYILYNHNDRAYRALVALRDITEIKEAEQKLLKAKVI